MTRHHTARTATKLGLTFLLAAGSPLLATAPAAAAPIGFVHAPDPGEGCPPRSSCPKDRPSPVTPSGATGAGGWMETTAWMTGDFNGDHRTDLAGSWNDADPSFPTSCGQHTVVLNVPVGWDQYEMDGGAPCGAEMAEVAEDPTDASPSTRGRPAATSGSCPRAPRRPGPAAGRAGVGMRSRSPTAASRHSGSRRWTGFLLRGSITSFANLTGEDRTSCGSTLSDLQLRVTYTVPAVGGPYVPPR
jgi:hypothetical protein